MQPQDIALTILNIFDRVSILKEKAKSPYKDHENRKVAFSLNKLYNKFRMD